MQVRAVQGWEQTPKAFIPSIELINQLPSINTGHVENGDRRCTATSTRTGKRCGKWAIKGLNVCLAHGGAQANARAAGERRVLARKAAEIARKTNADVPAHNGDPMAALAALFEQDSIMVARYAAAAEQHPDPAGKLDQAVHAGFRAERDAAAKRIDLFVRSGIAGELLKLRQQAQQRDVAATYGRVMAIVAAAAHRALITALLGRADLGVLPLAEVEPIAADALKGVQAEFGALQRSGTIKGRGAEQ